jgi:hypothetical protein
MALLPMKFGIFTLALLLSAAGCSLDGNSVEHRVGDHMFLVPKENSLETRIFWLPDDDRDGFAFILDPKSKIAEQISVTVEDSRDICDPRLNLGGVVADACHRLKHGVERTKTADIKLEAGPYAVWWAYRRKADTFDGSVQFAACSGEPANKKRALCFTVENYDDLILTISFKDKDVGSVDSILNNTRILLNKWEK